MAEHSDAQQFVAAPPDEGGLGFDRGISISSDALDVFDRQIRDLSLIHAPTEIGSYMDMNLFGQSTDSTPLPSPLISPLHLSLLQRIETIRDGVSVDDTLVHVSDDPLAPQTQVHLKFKFHFYNLTNFYSQVHI